MSAAVLVTGVSGLIGGAIAADLTSRGHDVAAVVRRAPQRMPDVRAWVRALGGDADRLVWIDGDLDRPALGLTAAALASLSAVERVFHAGGRFSWNLTPAQARRTNRDGLLELAMLCRRMPALRRFVLIGGYRGTGPVWDDVRRAGSEPMAAMWRYHGPYTGSKVEGLHAFRRAAMAMRLPYTVLHPGDVIGHSHTGITNQLTGMGSLAQLVHAGRLHALVGTPRAWIPMVPVDHLARLSVAASDSDTAMGREYFVLDDATPTLHEFVELSARTFGRSPPRFSIPTRVARWLPRSLTGVPSESLAFVSEQRYPVAATRALEAELGVGPPSIDAAVRRWLEFLVASGFRPELRG